MRSAFQASSTAARRPPASMRSGRAPPSAFALAKLETGAITLNVSEGRILEVEPGAGRFFGLLSLSEIPRRLSLDFSDFFRSGLSFNSITGTFGIDKGNAYTSKPRDQEPSRRHRGHRTHGTSRERLRPATRGDRTHGRDAADRRRACGGSGRRCRGARAPGRARQADGQGARLDLSRDRKLGEAAGDGRLARSAQSAAARPSRRKARTARPRPRRPNRLRERGCAGPGCDLPSPAPISGRQGPRAFLRRRAEPLNDRSHHAGRAPPAPPRRAFRERPRPRIRAADRPVDRRADLYFQHARSESWVLEDGIVKEGNHSIEQGVGVRALSGEKTGFAYSDEIVMPALLEAAGSARAIAQASANGINKPLSLATGRALYPAIDPIETLSSDEKIAAAARARCAVPLARSARQTGDREHRGEHGNDAARGGPTARSRRIFARSCASTCR